MDGSEYGPENESSKATSKLFMKQEQESDKEKDSLQGFI